MPPCPVFYVDVNICKYDLEPDLRWQKKDS
jgi:hypothetical protein